MKRNAIAIAALLAGLGLLSGCDADYVRTMPIYDVELTAVSDGEHEGRFAYGGFTYVVLTTTRGHRIVKIDLLKNRDERHARQAEGVLPRVIEKQTPNVDAVTGATTTSKALMKAVENSLTLRTATGGSGGS